MVRPPTRIRVHGRADRESGRRNAAARASSSAAMPGYMTRSGNECPMPVTPLARDNRNFRSLRSVRNAFAASVSSASRTICSIPVASPRIPGMTAPANSSELPASPCISSRGIFERGESARISNVGSSCGPDSMIPSTTPTQARPRPRAATRTPSVRRIAASRHAQAMPAARRPSTVICGMPPRNPRRNPRARSAGPAGPRCIAELSAPRNINGTQVAACAYWIMS